MTISAISTSAFISDTVIYIRDDLRTNITDPISSSRSSTSKFVMTSYPTRPTEYPLITVTDRGIVQQQRGGMQSSVVIDVIAVEIRCWCRNIKERDETSQSVLDRLRSIQKTSSTGTDAVGLFDFRLDSIVDVSETGEQGIKSKVITLTYMIILG